MFLQNFVLLFFQESGGQPSLLQSMLPFLVIILIMYFLLIRPQAKKQKERQAMLEKLKTGDEVVTSGGIHGKIVNLKEKTAVLRIAENTKVVVERSSISGPKGTTETK